MISKLLELLQTCDGAAVPHGRPGVFNQYRDRNPELDQAEAAAIRRSNLARYLEEFAGAAYVLVGEAAGDAGCRFSGIGYQQKIMRRIIKCIVII